MRHKINEKMCWRVSTNFETIVAFPDFLQPESYTVFTYAGLITRYLPNKQLGKKYCVIKVTRYIVYEKDRKPA